MSERTLTFTVNFDWSTVNWVMPPFHHGLFCPIDSIWTKLSPINQFFNLPDCRPESPPIVSPFLTRLSPDYINARQIEAVITYWPVSDDHVQIISAGLVFALKKSFCRDTRKGYYIRKYAGSGAKRKYSKKSIHLRIFKGL